MSRWRDDEREDAVWPRRWRRETQRPRLERARESDVVRRRRHRDASADPYVERLDLPRGDAREAVADGHTLSV